MTTTGKVAKGEVENCSGSKCFPFDVGYTASEISQMRALVERSLSCTQVITIQCHSAPLKVGDHFSNQFTRSHF